MEYRTEIIFYMKLKTIVIRASTTIYKRFNVQRTFMYTVFRMPSKPFHPSEDPTHIHAHFLECPLSVTKKFVLLPKFCIHLELQKKNQRRE